MVSSFCDLKISYFSYRGEKLKKYNTLLFDFRRSWDEYWSSYMSPNHSFNLVSMDDVKNVFNPKKRPVVEDQPSLDKKPSKNPEDSIISPDSGQGSADMDTAIDSPTTISTPSTLG